MPKIQLKILDSRLGNEIPMPYYATDGSADIDFRTCIEPEIILHPSETPLIPTGIAEFI